MARCPDGLFINGIRIPVRGASVGDGRPSDVARRLAAELGQGIDDEGRLRDLSREEAADVARAMGRLPDAVLLELERGNVRVRVVDASCPPRTGYPHYGLDGEGRPRPWPASVVDGRTVPYSGYYDTNTGTVVLRRDLLGDLGRTVHELGHALDDIRQENDFGRVCEDGRRLTSRSQVDPWLRGLFEEFEVATRRRPGDGPAPREWTPYHPDAGEYLAEGVRAYTDPALQEGLRAKDPGMADYLRAFLRDDKPS